MGVLRAMWLLLRAWFLSRSHLAAEDLALRQQLAVLKRSTKRPKLRPRDRVFWTWLMRFWPDWHSALIIVKPETVICLRTQVPNSGRSAPPKRKSRFLASVVIADAVSQRDLETQYGLNGDPPKPHPRDFQRRHRYVRQACLQPCRETPSDEYSERYEEKQ